MAASGKGSGRWRAVEDFVRLPGVYRDPSEGVVELGCLVESVGHQVGVDAEGDAGVGVAGDPGDLEDVRALRDQLAARSILSRGRSAPTSPLPGRTGRS